MFDDIKLVQMDRHLRPVAVHFVLPLA